MIKMAADGLSKKFGEIAQKVYAQQAPQGDPNMGGQQGFQGGAQQSGPQGDFVDADFTEVKEDDQEVIDCTPVGRDAPGITPRRRRALRECYPQHPPFQRG